MDTDENNYYRNGGAGGGGGYLTGGSPGSSPGGMGRVSGINWQETTYLAYFL